VKKKKKITLNPFRPKGVEGRRVRLRDRYIKLRWHILMATPLVIILGLFHWFFTFNVIVINTEFTENSDWLTLVFPTIVTIIIIILAIVIPIKIIEDSVFNSGFFRKRDKRQALAEMLYAEKIVIRKKTKDGKEREKFPEIYYHQGEDIDSFTFRTGREFSDKFYKSISENLEQLFLADLISRENRYKYITYEYLVDVISKRLNFEDTSVVEGALKLMKGVEWEFDEMPHMLVTGGTGGGKTFFLYTLIALLGKIGRVHIADPKRSDLTHLRKFNAFKDVVASENDEIMSMLEKAVELMEKRFKYMNEHEKQKMGTNYRYYDMPPEFFIIDEWGAFVSVLDYKQETKLYEMIAPLVLKARQAGVFLIIATQKAGTDVIRSMIRDNLMCKVSLGVLSATGYEMTFGDQGKTKVFFNKPKVKGRGYIDVGSGVVQEFYAPYVDIKKIDFETIFKAMPEMPYLNLSEVELTDSEREQFKREFEAQKTALEKENKAKQKEKARQVYEERERREKEILGGF